MPFVADHFRDATRRDARALSPDEASQVIQEAGERALQVFMAMSGLPREAAVNELNRRKQAGRTPSGCMRALNA